MLEATRLLSNWYEDPTNGVNAMLRTIEQRHGETVPAIASFKNEIDDVEVAQRLAPVNIPALYTLLEDPIQVDPGNPTRTKQIIDELPISTRIILQTSDTEQARRHAQLIGRAMIKSVNRFMYNENQASRVDNQVCITSVVNMTFVGLREQVGDFMAVAALLITFRAENLDP